MKLKDCTKAELIFVIKRLQMYSLSDGHFIQLALRDVEEEREARRLREARQLSGLQNQKMQEYIALLWSILPLNVHGWGRVFAWR